MPERETTNISVLSLKDKMYTQEGDKNRINMKRQHTERAERPKATEKREQKKKKIYYKGKQKIQK